jgi:spore coat polysaccharide biosynthesis protein SpsF
MKFLAMIQARCGSTRLPNKVLMDLEGKPALQWTIERVSQSKYVDEVMVVTSIEKANLQIVKLCCDLGIRVFIGSENDVLDRYYQAAKLLCPEYLIRVTADCPLYDAQLLDLAIMQLDENTDYASQLEQETYADGLDIEIIKFSALERSWREASLKSEREHVTQYIRKNPTIFALKDLKCPIPGLENERWTLDHEEDYSVIRAVYQHFSEMGVEYPNTEQVYKYLLDHEEVHKINKAYSRNEGLMKSLLEDAAK